MTDPYSGPLRIEKAGEPITNVDDWLRIAGPEGGERQWKDRHSAKEIARAWCEPAVGVPNEFAALLESHPLTAGLQIGLVEPEVELRLDAYRGKTRQTDLLIRATDGESKALLAVEAKAEESFGPRVGEALASSGERSKRPDRINSLCELIFGHPYSDNERALSNLRYQLLHGIGGLVLGARADQASVAAFVVHVFGPGLQANRADLRAFLAATGCNDDPDGRLVELPIASRDPKGPETVLLGECHRGV